MAPNAVYAGYVLASLVLLVIVYTQSALDLRGVGRLRLRRPLLAADEADYDEEELDRRADYGRSEEVMIMPRADLAMLVTVFGALGVFLAGAAGFLGPRLIDFAFRPGDASISALEWTAGKPLERVAQITGAICLGLIALRMIRVFIVVAIFALLAAAAHVSVAYALGRPIWTAFGF